MEPEDTLSRLAVSLAIGLLVGLERGWRTRDEQDHHRAAGFRTFALTGLLGGVSGALSLRSGGEVVAAVFVVFAGAFTAFHWLEAKAEQNFSVTSAVAGMLTFLLGALAVTGDLLVAIACAVTMTLILALREQLHRWVASLTWPEIRAVLTLLAMSFLLLPVLPNRPIDPYQAINPYEIWLLTIIIAGVSFIGYIGIKLFGARLGVVLTAISGGLASSTATTITFARLAGEHPASANLLSAGIMISSIIMLARTGILAIALNPALLPRLVPPLAVAALIFAAAAAVLLLRNTEQESPDLRIENPLAFGTALKLGGLIAGVMLAAKLLMDVFGNVGVFAVAGISGLADVDAVTISMARMAGADIGVGVSAIAILLAAAVNTATKVALSASLAGYKPAILVSAASALAVVAGALTALWTATS